MKKLFKFLIAVIILSAAIYAQNGVSTYSNTEAFTADERRSKVQAKIVVNKETEPKEVQEAEKGFFEYYLEFFFLDEDMCFCNEEAFIQEIEEFSKYFFDSFGGTIPLSECHIPVPQTGKAIKKKTI